MLTRPRDPFGALRPRGEGVEAQPVVRGRNLSKADVYRTRTDDGDVAVKTVENRPWLCRRIVGALLLRREAKVLSRLGPVEGVPSLLSATRERLVLAWVDGERLADRKRRGIDATTAAEFDATVRRLHARGFAHGDIGRDDVVLGRDGKVTLLDFATGVGPGCPPVLWRVLVPFLQHRDRVRTRRLARRYLDRAGRRRGGSVATSRDARA